MLPQDERPTKGGTRRSQEAVFLNLERVYNMRQYDLGSAAHTRVKLCGRIAVFKHSGSPHFFVISYTFLCLHTILACCNLQVVTSSHYHSQAVSYLLIKKHGRVNIRLSPVHRNIRATEDLQLAITCVTTRIYPLYRLASRAVLRRLDLVALQRDQHL